MSLRQSSLATPHPTGVSGQCEHGGQPRLWDGGSAQVSAACNMRKAHIHGTVHCARLNSMTTSSPAEIISASGRLTWNHHSMPEAS